jgi:hypothetical protein
MNGLEAWQEVIRAGWEGLVAKDPESPQRRRPLARVAQGEAAPLPRGRAGVGGDAAVAAGHASASALRRVEPFTWSE